MIRELKLKYYLTIELSGSKIIRHSVLLIANISYPVVGINVVYSEDIEAINT